MLVAILTALVAPAFPLAYAVLIALFAYTMLRTKERFLIPLVCCNALTAFLIYDVVTAICFVMIGLCGALLLYAMQKAQFSNAYTAAAVAASTLVFLYCIVCLPGIVTGEGPYALAHLVMDQSLAMTREMMESTLGQAQNALFDWDAVTAYVAEAVEVMTVPALFSVAAVAGLSNFLFFRLFARKKNLPIPKMRKLRDWSIPNSLTTGLFILLIGSLILEFTDLTYAAAVSNTVNVLVGVPLMLQGLAAIDFFIVRSAKSVTAKRVITYVLCGIFFSLIQSVLVMIGCAEQVFRFRERSNVITL